MANTYFQFKQFTIHQDKCGMKVGTDGVLLGAWAAVEHAKSILDIGAGTGLVALMLAQRSNAQITAVEIDQDAAIQAAANAADSPWADRVKIINVDFNLFQPDQQFDVIVSNPPYFVESMKAADKQRLLARHDDGLSFEDLFRGVSRLLSAEGVFTLILPIEVRDRIVKIAENAGLYPCRWLNIITKPGADPKRCILSFSCAKSAYIAENLLIELERHIYSKEYIDLTKEFYLNL